MDPRQFDNAELFRHATEALARPRQRITRPDTAPAGHGYLQIVVGLLLVGALACLYVVRVEQRKAERRPAFVSDTADIVRIDGKRPSGGHLFLTAVRRSRPQARVAADSVVAMETSRRSATRAALGCVDPSRRRSVSIVPGRLTGGSAGLMFALTIVDALEPFDIDVQIAGTGTISATGVVGPIADIGMKARAARDAGADMFLAPRAQASDAKRAARDLRVVGVNTLDDALRAIRHTTGCNRSEGETPDDLKREIRG